MPSPSDASLLMLQGTCKRGELCPFAHGVFEAWLHPARYRTQACRDGAACGRPICFFAHRYICKASMLPKPDGLRPPLAAPRGLHQQRRECCPRYSRSVTAKYIDAFVDSIAARPTAASDQPHSRAAPTHMHDELIAVSNDAARSMG